MSLSPFDPSSMNTKDAIKAADGLSDAELDAVYEAELDGKARKSILDKLTAMREDLRAAEAAPEETPVAIEAPEAPAAKAERIPHPWAFIR